MTVALLSFPLNRDQYKRVRVEWGVITNRLKDFGVTLSPEGTLSGKISGQIVFTPERLDINITDKPFYVTEGKLRSVINEWLAG